MKIHSMTATFGKLEHETLTLESGLNVISAGNEWGKSTWCTFLAVMLYGLDTRAKSTKTALADKERYAPWSGSPMSGRIDLNWQGRDITIERATAGRTPMGNFRAYETATGLAVPELTAQNCGEMLLGVERSVFLRTGFIRFTDLNVTDDEALRRRLNSLVTTGDENSAADTLAGELKTLKNRIRHNRTGLLPQAEAERDRLEGKCRELQALEEHNDEILRKLDSNEDWRLALENHMDALAYAASREDARKVAQAETALREAWTHFEESKSFCDSLPDRETAQARLDEIYGLQDSLLELQQQFRALPVEALPAQLPQQFSGLSGEAARRKAVEDALRHQKLSAGFDVFLVLGILLVLEGLVGMYFRPVPGLICCVAGAAAVIWCGVRKMLRNRARRELEAFYGSDDREAWQALAAEYEALLMAHEQELATIRLQRRRLEEALEAARQRFREITGEPGGRSRVAWESVLDAWDARDEALRSVHKAKAHYEDLKTMARQAKPPEFHDRLEHSEAYTLRLLAECAAERTRLENLQGQCRGSMETIGSKSELEKELARVNGRIGKLEQTYGALTIAQETLTEARQALQRRFAPRIARRAGELMSAMTEGHYDRLSIGENLSLRAGARQEDTLHEALWRSDGTVDQLYLSLRLAVAEALLPESPLVLDDALVRFDDVRLKAAMSILREEAQNRQVILFTCHSREKQA